MIYHSNSMEQQAILQTASRMCAAARTAPKATGRDTIHTIVLTDSDKDRLAGQMERMGERDFPDGGAGWYVRDADNVRAAQAVVLIGAERGYRGIGNCFYCGFENCAACRSAGGNCAFAYIDLGIALSSAMLAAMDDRIDNRVMMSVGKAAMEMEEFGTNILWHGIPVSISGKNVFFDRGREH